MVLKSLTPFPYYGGKARMAPLICDMLDYRNTDIYIEPFGGAARTLLNKSRHKIEIYNDSSAGLCAFMRVMSNKDTANELINKLYETEHSVEEFYHALMIRNEAEDHLIDELKRQAFLYVKQLFFKYNSNELKLLKENIKRKKVNGIEEAYKMLLSRNILENKELVILEEFKNLFDNYKDIYRSIVLRSYKQFYKINFEEFKKSTIEVVNEKISVYLEKLKLVDNEDEHDKTVLGKKVKKLEEVLPSIYNMKLFDIDKSIKKKLKERSYKQACKTAYYETSNNHDDANIDEMDLAVATYVIYSQSRDGMGKDWSSAKYRSTDSYYNNISRLYDIAERLEGVHVSQADALSYVLDSPYINNERVMLYLDPSYLDPKNEEKNLGTLYKDSFDREDHEVLLKAIYRAKCKILISNYDVELYNRYLNRDNGWSRTEFKTNTTVGNKKDNTRIEVLWYNY